MCNAELRRLGHKGRIDQRTYVKQGVKKVPSAHIGSASAQMEVKFFRAKNREIAEATEQAKNQHNVHATQKQ